MPSMSGMLMSINTTSGLTWLATVTASLPDAAAPTTSMSVSNPSSFVRWSRVSGMSSTIRTRIWSAIRSVGPIGLDAAMVVEAWSPENWTGAGPVVRRARRAGLGEEVAPGDRWLASDYLAQLRREDGLDELRDRNREVGGQLLERDALRAARRRDDQLTRGRVVEVGHGPEDEADRAVELGELDDFRLRRRRHGEDDDLLLARQRRRRIAGRRLLPLLLLLLRLDRRRDLAAEDLEALE